MVTFLVETFVPQGDRDRFAVAVDGLQAALEAMTDLAHHVEHVRSYLVPSDEMGVHVVQADTVEAVRQLAKLARIEVERIVAVVGVDPGVAVAERMDVAPRMHQ